MYKNILVIVLSILFLFSYHLSFARENRLQVHFLDVGQGDSILLITPDKKYILVDGGPGGQVVEELAKFMPFWHKKIDYVIATHGDADHVTGLVEVFERYDVGAFVYNGEQKETIVYRKLMELVNLEGADRLSVTDKTDFVIGCCLVLDMLWPTAGFDESLGSNDSSVAFLATYREFDIYLAGDLSSEFELSMIEDLNRKVEIHKASHHGSRSSTPVELVDRLRSEVTVISAGLDNRYSHPHEEVLEILSENRSQVYRTDLHGSVSVFSDGSGFVVKTEHSL